MLRFDREYSTVGLTVHCFQLDGSNLLHVSTRRMARMHRCASCCGFHRRFWRSTIVNHPLSNLHYLIHLDSTLDVASANRTVPHLPTSTSPASEPKTIRKPPELPIRLDRIGASELGQPIQTNRLTSHPSGPLQPYPPTARAPTQNVIYSAAQRSWDRKNRLVVPDLDVSHAFPYTFFFSFACVRTIGSSPSSHGEEHYSRVSFIVTSVKHQLGQRAVWFGH